MTLDRDAFETLAAAVCTPVATLNTPAGMSVCSVTRRPSRVAFQGVSGAGLSTVVLPVASTWATLLIVTSNG